MRAFLTRGIEALMYAHGNYVLHREADQTWAVYVEVGHGDFEWVHSAHSHTEALEYARCATKEYKHV